LGDVVEYLEDVVAELEKTSVSCSIAIQEEDHDDFRLGFQPGALLEKQLLVYVSFSV
jgi:hypothetical protein